MALKHQRMGPAWNWRPALSKVREVYASVIPVVLGLSMTQVCTVLDSVLAWGLAPGDEGQPAPLTSWGLSAPFVTGSATALYIGQRMYQFPTGVFGVALGTVLFPVLARHAERQEMLEFRETLTRGLRLVMIIGFPASAGLVLLADPITSVLFHRGSVTSEGARIITHMIAAYGTFVWAVIGLGILNRGFYALGDRLTPLKLGLVAVTCNLCLNLTLVWFLGSYGLVFGTATSTILQLLLAVKLAAGRQAPFPWRSLAQCLVKTLISTAGMIALGLVALHFIPLHGGRGIQAAILVVHLGLGVASYVAFGLILKLEEVPGLLRMLWRGRSQ